MKSILSLTFISFISILFSLQSTAQSLTHNTPKSSVQAMMASKLDQSQRLFAALIAKDYEGISKAARILGTISKATEWHKVDDPDFKHYATSFQNSIDDLVEQAAKKNYEGVGMGYMRLTLACMYCHNNLRFDDPKYQDPKPKVLKK